MPSLKARLCGSLRLPVCCRLIFKNGKMIIMRHLPECKTKRCMLALLYRKGVNPVTKLFIKPLFK